jgi:hypothetical protein
MCMKEKWDQGNVVNDLKGSQSESASHQPLVPNLSFTYNPTRTRTRNPKDVFADLKVRFVLNSSSMFCKIIGSTLGERGNACSYADKGQGVEVYKGDWMKDKLSGKGELCVFKGAPAQLLSKYSGDWYSDLQQGKGSIEYENGKMLFLRRFVETGQQEGHGSWTRWMEEGRPVGPRHNHLFQQQPVGKG